VTDKGLSSDIPGLGLLGFSEVFVLRFSVFLPSESFEKNSSASSPNKNPVMVSFAEWKSLIAVVCARIVMNKERSSMADGPGCRP
jgi:hypothetical protein